MHEIVKRDFCERAQIVVHGRERAGRKGQTAVGRNGLHAEAVLEQFPNSRAFDPTGKGSFTSIPATRTCPLIPASKNRSSCPPRGCPAPTRVVRGTVEEKATRQWWFQSTPIGVPLWRLPWLEGRLPIGLPLGEVADNRQLDALAVERVDQQNDPHDDKSDKHQWK